MKMYKKGQKVINVDLVQMSLMEENGWSRTEALASTPKAPKDEAAPEKEAGEAEEAQPEAEAPKADAPAEVKEEEKSAPKKDAKAKKSGKRRVVKGK